MAELREARLTWLERVHANDGAKMLGWICKVLERGVDIALVALCCHYCTTPFMPFVPDHLGGWRPLLALLGLPVLSHACAELRTSTGGGAAARLDRLDRLARWLQAARNIPATARPPRFRPAARTAPAETLRELRALWAAQGGRALVVALAGWPVLQVQAWLLAALQPPRSALGSDADTER